MKKYYISILIVIAVVFGTCLAVLCGCKQYEHQAQYYYITYLANDGGAISGDSLQKITENESTTQVIAIPNVGYEFVKWSDGIVSATRTDNNVTDNKTIEAIFEKISYTVKYETNGNGYIEGATTQAVSYNDTATKVSAIPNEGYKFVKWSDGIVRATRTDNNITDNKTIEAIFEKIIYTVKYETDGNGYIEGVTTQAVSYNDNATKVTAIPDDGYEFIGWSDGKITEATRFDTNIKSDIKVYAIFTRIMLSVRYSSTEGGNIRYLTNKVLYVKYGESGGIVHAIPNKDFIFIKWSDGVLTPERQDINIKEDIDVNALFGYSVSYKVDGERGGKVVGDTFQMALPNESYNKVTAVADEGFVFSGWSDMILSKERMDISERCLEYVAYFEPIEKTFKYDYNYNDCISALSKITINRNSLQDVCFEIPTREGFTFCGWYIDKNFTTKIADENGNLMLGYYIFVLETDTIYAKWKDIGDKAIVHKVLLVMVDEIHASLYSTEVDGFKTVDYKMSAIERNVLALIPEKFSDYLNDCFDGQFIFEVDTYFTTVPINSNCFRYLSDSTGRHTNYKIETKKIFEIGQFLNLYHNILTAFGLNDYLNVYHSGAGLADIKYANVNIESLFPDFYLKKTPYQDRYNILKSDKYFNSDKWAPMISTFIHEFAHTVEMYYNWTLYEYHKALNLGGTLVITKKYLTGTLEIDGEYVGIPRDYWLHNIDIRVSYRPSDECYNQGKVILINGEPYYESCVVVRVPYGGEITVEAVPYEGYKFVRWSDGVTSAVRHDINIISYLSAEAIFEKIE